MTVINCLPVKNKMKNVFLENHVFTRFNLVMHYYKCYMLYVKKAYIFELSWMYVTHFINFFPNKSCFKPSNCNIVDFKKYTSPSLLHNYFIFITNMPHNGFIYEARMDMMENSGHWCYMFTVYVYMHKRP